MLACPKCNSYMFPGQKRRVSIDCCSGCKGIWLDAGELAAITNTSRDLLAQNGLSTPTNFRCPRDGDSLNEQPYSDTTRLMVDKCNKCSGVYLDKGELEQIQGLAERVESAFPPKHQQAMANNARRSEALSAVYKTDTPVAKQPISDRVAFVEKVYGLLVLTLLVTAGAAYFGISSGLAVKYFIPALIAEVIVFIIALVTKRTPGINMIALFSYTGLSGFTLAAVLQHYLTAGHASIIWQAAGITAFVFTVLSAYVHVTKKDFDWMGGMLLVGLILLIVTGIGMLFFGGAFSWFLWSCISAFIFCGYILYDTSRIILKYDTEETVSAVLDLYLDIINLFLDMLRILSYLQGKN